MTQREPIFNIPAPIVIFAVFLIAVHAITVIDPAFHLRLIKQFAFFSNGAFFPGAVTYALLHADWGHVIINTVMMVAFGKPLVLRLGLIRFAVFSVILTLAGALAQSFQPHISMIGASAITSGFFAATLRMPHFGADDYAFAPLISIKEILTSKRHLTIIIVWLGINYLFGSGVIDIYGGLNVAWEAHVGGFFAGLLLFYFFDRAPYSSQ